MSEPAISVLMPAFNAEKYIAEAVNSILTQSFRDFELIILNDGSDDHTKEILDNIVDDRVACIHLDKNQGLVNARNNLVSAARGRYIAFLDADDVALPNRLQTQLSFLESGVADVCGGAYDAIYQVTGNRKPSKQRYSDADIKALLTVYSPLCNPAIMGKAEVFKGHPYRYGKDSAEDYSLWVDLALANYRFANVREKLILYRIHADQTTQTKTTITNTIFAKSRDEYLTGLGISLKLSPRPMQFNERIKSALQFMWELNKRYSGISVGANYEIYARFQYRGNRLLTPFTRLERFIVSLLASIIGR